MAAPKALSRISVHDAVSKYVEAMDRRVARNDMSQKTRDIYARDLAEFTDIFGADAVLDDIESEDIEHAMTTIARAPDKRYTRGLKIGADGTTPAGRGPHALARWFAAVRGLFRWAAERGFVQVDPCTEIRPPKVPKRAKGSRLGISIDDARALRAAPAAAVAETERVRVDQRLALRDEAILLLLCESGPRVSEVCGANRTDIRLHEETGSPVLHVLGKGRKERDVPLSEQTMAAIAAYTEHERPKPPKPTDPNDRVEAARIHDASRALFVTVRGRRMSPRDVQRMIERYAKTTLDRHASPHSLRHTALTILARSGVDIATVAQVAGHASVGTTSIYVDDSMVAAVAAINGSPINKDAGQTG